ncbi:restriction endonuclease subunit S [Brachyspira hyodysenteriae]|uniref:restriction endonuclease subunit S n=1 Tax=Brachyspira hyodysenteriae TaxID=159 RepID=UPI0022CD683F|nr:restriction endonuclease subunit S [Brachyspira hyodysenteriae]MCZ9957093.1 restriction endonuclease subunit S [Brachyspira hyodysenteriae]
MIAAKEKCFTVKFSEIKNKRIDVLHYIPNNIICRFNCKQINEISYNLQTGSTPSGGVFAKSGVPYFRSQDLDLFNLSINQYIDTEFHKQIERSTVIPNDILVAVVGASIGKIALVPNDIKEGNINQNISRIRIKNLNEICPTYIAIYLNLFPECLIKASTVTTQPYINNTELGNIKIPIPPIEIQNNIADEVMDRREKAFKLQEEAKKDY